MKTLPVAVILLVLALVGSCGPKPAVKPLPTPSKAGDKLFLEAEKVYAAGAFDEALALYNDYLVRFPKGSLAPAALMKIGSIQLKAGNYEKSRSAYQRLIADYPGSAFAADARLEMLSSYYRQGKYAEVITRAPEVLAQLDVPAVIMRLDVLVGDAYLASGYALDALEYYSAAQKIAAATEKAAVAAKLKEAIAGLDTDDVALLLESPRENLPMDYVMLQLGLNYSMEEKYDDALKILEKLTAEYPASPAAVPARNLMAEIKKNALFKRDTIGCLLPLSGPYQRFGEKALQGIELALDLFNSRAGHPSLNVVIRDTAADVQKTRQAMQELSREQVAAVVGPIVTAEAAGREAQDMGIPIITMTQKDKIPSLGDYVFRNFITPKMQVRALADYAVNTLGLSRFAILYPNENYGITFMNLFWDELIADGARVVGLEAYNPAHTDFADPIKKLVGLYYELPPDLVPVTEPGPEKEDRPEALAGLNGPVENNPAEEKKQPQAIVDFDAVFIPDAPKKSGLIVPQLAFYDVKDVLLLGTNLWHSKTLIKMAAQYVQGAVMPDGFFAASPSPAVQDFVTKFEQTYQQTPGFIEAVAYDTAMMLFEVVGRPHLRFRNEIRDALLNSDGFPGATGLTRFDENGDALKRLTLLRIAGKRFVQLKQD